MKIIFSRKGFDSTAGGVPSPILSDGTLLSLPIPDKRSPIRYGDIHLYGHNLGTVVSQLTAHRKQRIQHDWCAHLDPDLMSEAAPRRPEWRPLLGQCDAAQRVLEHSEVGAGDLFLFFGLFRQIEDGVGPYRFCRAARPLHVLWGWLQIDRVMRLESGAVPSWTRGHPHVAAPEGRRHNTLYIARNWLKVDGVETQFPGAGVFRRFHSRLQLTAADQERCSVWELPGCFFPESGNPQLGFHRNPARWTRNGEFTYLQTVARGQEFVFDASGNAAAIKWARALIRACTER